MTTFTDLMVTDAPQGTSPWYNSPWAALAAQLDANFNALLSGGFTSTTSQTIGNGIKTFTVGSGQTPSSTLIGQLMSIYSNSARSNSMAGKVTGTTDTTITINVTVNAGSGTYTDWIITSPLSLPATRTTRDITTGTTVGLTDIGSMINVSSGSPAVTLSSPSSMGAGYNVGIQNEGSGTATVSVSGGSSINGQSSLSLSQYSSIELLVKADASAYDITSAFRFPSSGLIVTSARTSNTILAAADSGTLINVTSGTFSQTLTAAATLGAGWYCYYKNSGTGIVTLDPNSSETIDGLTTMNVYTGESFLIVCTGTAFLTVARRGAGAKVLLSESLNISGVASADFSAPTDSELDTFIIEIVGLSMAAAENILFRVQTSGSVITSANYFGNWVQTNNTGGPTGTTISAATSFRFDFGLDGDSFSSLNATIKFGNYNSSTKMKGWTGRCQQSLYVTSVGWIDFGGGLGNSLPATGDPLTLVRIFSSGGSNFTARAIRCYGVRQ